MIPQMLRNYTHKKNESVTFSVGWFAEVPQDVGLAVKRLKSNNEVGQDKLQWFISGKVIIMGKSEKWRF